MSQSILEATIAEVLQRHALIGSRLVVGVSGGPDSLALTYALARQRQTLDLDLQLAHFDHGLRPESADDARFVRQTAGALGLPITVGSGDLAAAARRLGLGLEDAARRARQCFFAEVADQVQAAAVLLGHTRDDQSETRLMHLTRGSGLRGLIGMAEEATLLVAGHRSLRLVRPLLALRREDTEGYCQDLGLAPRIDQTNQERRFTRNRLRHDILPALRAINPGVDEALERLGRSAAEAEEFIQSELDRRLPDVVEATAPAWVIRRTAFRGLPPTLQRALVRRAADSRSASPDQTIGAAAIDAATAAINSWPTGKVLEWPGQRTVRIAYASATIGGPPHPSAEPTGEVALAIPGQTPLILSPALTGGTQPTPGALRCHRRALPCAERSGERFHVDLDWARLSAAGAPRLRSRQPGDWLQPAGMTGRKKLQDILVDARIPRSERDRVPLLVAGESIVWAIGLRSDRRFLAGAESIDVLCVDVVVDQVACTAGAREEPEEWPS